MHSTHRRLSTIVHNLIHTRPAGTPQTFRVVNPVSGLAHSVQRSTAADADAAIEAAAAGLGEWRATPLVQRQAVLSRAADLLADVDPDNTDTGGGWGSRLVAVNRRETPVSSFWATAQIGMAAGALRALVDSSGAALAPQVLEEENATFTIEREPYGVCLAIAAWNAVHVLTLRGIATPLLAGNTVVLKTSETAPGTQALIAELLFAAGLPRSALSVLHAARDDAPAITEQLVADSRIRHVNFTGSTRVGSAIAALAGKHLKPSLMELGGKAPVVLLPDADLETAASHIIFGAFLNAGQICMSTERIIVPESKYDALVAELKAAWDAVESKPARALFDRTLATRVRSLTSDAVGAGATALFPQEQQQEDALVTPTILGRVTPAMKVYADESFGPLSGIITVPDAGRDASAVIDEMVRIANDTEYGLSAAVWGRDTERAAGVARKIEAGAVHVNAPTPADPPTVPHGGWKSSGWGRFNGAEGLRSFTQTRSIEVAKDPHPLPLEVFEL